MDQEEERRFYTDSVMVLQRAPIVPVWNTGKLAYIVDSNLESTLCATLSKSF